MIIPGNRGDFLPSLSNQAATIAKHGFRNSLGWMVMPGKRDPAARAFDLDTQHHRRSGQSQRDKAPGDGQPS